MAHLINSSPINPEHLVSTKSQPTHLVAYKETREGLYGPYEVEVTEKAPEVRYLYPLTAVFRVSCAGMYFYLSFFLCFGVRGCQRHAWLEGAGEGREP